jgi:hypothetical protein
MIMGQVLDPPVPAAIGHPGVEWLNGGVVQGYVFGGLPQIPAQGDHLLCLGAPDETDFLLENDGLQGLESAREKLRRRPLDRFWRFPGLDAELL